MSLIVEKLTGTAVVIDDLGITITGVAGTQYDLIQHSPSDVTLSARVGGDLKVAVDAGELLVVDPRSGHTGNLVAADSLIALQAHNDAHIGIQLASITDLDDVGGVPGAGEVLEFNNGTGQYEPVAASVIAGNMAIGDLSDVDDPGTHTASTVYLFKGDGTNLDVIGFAGDADVIEAVQDIIGATGINGTDTTFTYNDTNGTIEWSVDDVFLRNTGDTLDSGTLTIASGASIDIATGGDLTIVDPPVNPTDAANKAYVDSIASGLDPKDAVIAATTGNDIGFTYNDTASGPTDGVGDTLTATVNGVTPLDGVTLSVGERVLIKDQTGVAGFADAAISGAPAGSTVSSLSAGTYDFDVTVDGGAPQILSITTAGGEDYDAIAALMNTQVTGGSVAFVAGAFQVTSGSLGVASTVTVAAGTAGSGGGDLFAAIDTADTVTTTFPAPTVGTASLQNGIYTVTQAGDGSNPTILTRATDFDGSPANEVSEGNYVLVTQGTVNAGSGWVVTGTPVILGGDIVVGNDPIAWTQFSESSSFTAGDGLDLTGSVFSLDINNMSAATIALGDEIAFNDVSGVDTPQNTTVQNMFNDLNVPYGITGTGIMVQTADDTYTKVSIAVDGLGALDGLVVANGDGTGGNPTIGLDVQNLPLLGEAIDQANDMLILWNPSTGANERVSVSSVVNAGAAPGYGVFVADTGSATATTVSESITFSGDGIAVVAADGTPDTIAFNLDISDLTTIGAGTIALTDEFGIDDGTATNKRATFTDLVTDLQIPNAIGAGSGYVVSDGAGAYTTRTIGVDAAGNLDGLAITGGNGTANTVIGLDIVGNALAGEDVAAGDLFIGYNLSGLANEAFTAQEMADGLFSLAGGLANAYSSFVGGDGGTTAVAIGGDTITMNGTGINVTTTNSTAGLDTINLDLDINDLTPGAETLLLGDNIAVYDGTDTLKYTFTDVVSDLQIPNAIGAGVGFMVSDGAGNYTTRTITVAGVGLGDGLAITNGDGTTSNVVLELDIDGSPAAGEDMAAADEFIGNNATATANEKFTGQEIADGVSTILGISNLTFSTINGQTILTYVDATRGSTLSTDSFTVSFFENRIGNNDWANIGGAIDATSGYIVPMNATIVGATMHTANNNGNTKNLDLYVDGVSTASILGVTGAAGEKEDRDETLNIDVNQDQKVRVRGDAAGGTIEDTVVTLWLRWRV